MKYSHVFLDFDETLFNHHEYIQWADSVLAELLGREEGFYATQFKQFHEQLEDPNLRLFHHEEHSSFTTGKGWEYVSGELERARRAIKHDFCYPDTHEFLEWIAKQKVDLRILTFGAGDYQRYKINTCAVVRKLHIPVHVVYEPKPKFLQREFGRGKGVLVDDKYLLELPNNWDEIWINRKSEMHKPELLPPKTFKVSTLQQIPSLLQKA